MNATDNLPTSIAEAGQLLRAGGWTAEALARAHLERIRERQPALNAFITVTEERAMEVARARDAELRRGRDRGPLHGIPIAYKDNIDTAHVRTTVGSAFLRDRVPNRDAEIVRRLTDAGMVMLGKLNMSEFASGSSGRNAFFGDVHNPWDLARAPGGSSSGNGAAISAGMCLAAVGTDSGGSIRQPSSRCGIFGLRPTHGRVSLAGIWPRAPSLGSAGPMTRNVKDAALIMNALAGYDPNYPRSLKVPAEDFTAQLDAGVAGLKLAIVDDYTFRDIDPEVEHVLREAIQVLAGLGARVETITVPELTGTLDYGKLFSSVLLYEFNQVLGARYRSADPALFGNAVRSDLERGAQIPEATYRQILDERPAHSVAIKAAFKNVDALLVPILPNVTPLQSAGPEVWALGRRFNLPFSFIGVPSISIPCGFAAGMPVGLQIVANDLQEALLLRIGAAFESVTEHHLQHPTAL